MRKVFSESGLKEHSAELLKPTRIYVKPVLSLLEYKINGVSHITGGAFYDKIARILPDKVNVKIYKKSWQIPEIFRLIQKKGNIDDKEMYHTFNMGMGMVLIAELNSAEAIITKLKSFKLNSTIIGDVIKGEAKVEID